jgi:hypothetical protein
MESWLNRETIFRKTIIAFLAEGTRDIGQTAELLGVDSRTVAKWMSGDAVPHKLLQPCILEILQQDRDSANNSAT